MGLFYTRRGHYIIPLRDFVKRKSGVRHARPDYLQDRKSTLKMVQPAPLGGAATQH